MINRTTDFNFVSRNARPRKTADGIEILPWHQFLKALWAGEIVA